MKCPEQTITRFNEFIYNIEHEKWRLGFVLEDGYFKFIEDLRDSAQTLVDVCKKLLEEEI
jgi:hypothetical protein